MPSENGIHTCVLSCCGWNNGCGGECMHPWMLIYDVGAHNRYLLSQQLHIQNDTVFHRNDMSCAVDNEKCENPIILLLCLILCYRYAPLTM